MPSRTLSDQLEKVHEGIDRWCERPLSRPYPHVSVDGVWRRRSWGGAVENVSMPVAIGVGVDGRREAVGVAEGIREDAAGWRNLIACLIARGLRGVRMAAGGRCAGLVNIVGELLPQARCRRCMAHFMRGCVCLLVSGPVWRVIVFQMSGRF
jgi:transposase-like protein